MTLNYLFAIIILMGHLENMGLGQPHTQFYRWKAAGKRPVLSVTKRSFFLVQKSMIIKFSKIDCHLWDCEGGKRIMEGLFSSFISTKDKCSVRSNLVNYEICHRLWVVMVELVINVQVIRFTENCNVNCGYCQNCCVAIDKEVEFVWIKHIRRSVKV